MSSSNNCAAVLEAAGIADLFDARVDGLDVTRLGLSGKPAPDAFLEAARGLEVQPSRAVVVEDAMAGVEAGRAGGFGSVIGVDRGGRSLAPAPGWRRCHGDQPGAGPGGHRALVRVVVGVRGVRSREGRYPRSLVHPGKWLLRDACGRQADVLMLFYVFSAEELRELFARLGYPFEYNTIPRNVAYYAAWTTHGSALCRVVHAWVLARSDRPGSMRYFAEALQSDVGDVQQGTTAEGVHLGAMAGTVDLAGRVSTGIELSGDVLRFNPELPPDMERLDMRIRYRGHSLDLRLTRHTLTVRGRDRGPGPIRLGVKDDVYEFAAGSTRVFEIR